MKIKRLVIGISGASGIPLAIHLLELMRSQDSWETHLVISPGAERTIREETCYTPDDIFPLASKHHSINDIGASIASGTFRTEGMVIIPCSMKTVAGVIHGYSDNLLLRAADVTIKERRKLVLVARETPLSAIHLRNLAELVSLGVVIMPPMMTFYNQPQTISDMTHHIVAKVMHEFGLEAPGFRRWGEASTDLLPT
ncbi:MAG: UbiX family flavin prenyltransferase [Desulfuromonadales bacterium]|nr:UbiX family flavin prenyltransferase [Desulfuromonadales bacterium]